MDTEYPPRAIDGDLSLRVPVNGEQFFAWITHEALADGFGYNLEQHGSPVQFWAAHEDKISQMLRAVMLPGVAYTKDNPLTLRYSDIERLRRT